MFNFTTIFKKKKSANDLLSIENNYLKSTLQSLRSEINENNIIDENNVLKEIIISLKNEINILEQNNPLLCPITHELAKNIVISEIDGRCYEKSAILDWLNIKTKSPITNETMNKFHLHDTQSIYTHIIQLHKDNKCIYTSFKQQQEKNTDVIKNLYQARKHILSLKSELNESKNSTCPRIVHKVHKYVPTPPSVPRPSTPPMPPPTLF